MASFEFSTGVTQLQYVVKLPLKIQRKDQASDTAVLTSVHQSLCIGTLEGHEVIEGIGVIVTLLTSIAVVLGLNLSVHIDCHSKSFKIITDQSSFHSTIHSPDTGSIVN